MPDITSIQRETWVGKACQPLPQRGTACAAV